MNTYNETKKNSDEVDIKEYLFYFLSKWKVFALTLAAFLLFALLYLYTTMPIYQVSATIMVRDEKRGGDFLSELSVFEGIDAMYNSNTDNEIEVLRSKTLIKNVILSTQLYKKTIGKTFFRKTDLSDDSPIILSDTLMDVMSIEKPYRIEIDVEGDQYEARLYRGKVFEKDTVFQHFPIRLRTSCGLLDLSCEDIDRLGECSEYEIYIASPIQLARTYLKDLRVTSASKNSSIVNLKFNTTNIERGKLFLNTLISKYNASAIEEKNEVLAKTADFINERVLMLSEELGTTEKNLEKMKKREGLTDLSANAELYLKQSAGYEQQRVTNETQLNLVRSIKKYLSEDENRGNAIPSNVGLADEGLVQQINQYNQLLLVRNKLSRSTSEKNPVVLQQSAQIESLYDNIKLLVRNVENALVIEYNDLKKQHDKYRGLIYNIPTQERLSVEIERQRQIQQQLFLLLLQKREENALTMAATVSKAKIVEECMVEPEPIEPKPLLIILATALFAILFAAIAVLLRKYFNIHIENSWIIEKENLTELPILADLPFFEDNQKGLEFDEFRMEAFRSLRTNMQFLLKNETHKAIIFTSFMPNEGKTFVSANTAISFASLGKHVIVVGADIRNPELSSFFSNYSSAGLSNYLSDKRIEIDELIIKTSIDGLDYIPAGPVPPNSTELLSPWFRTRSCWDGWQTCPSSFSEQGNRTKTG